MAHSVEALESAILKLQPAHHQTSRNTLDLDVLQRLD